MLAHFTPLARLGKCDRNRLLVHIQTDVADKLFHGPSPMHEARHRPSGAVLVSLHTVRRVAQYLRRTSGLGRSSFNPTVLTTPAFIRQTIRCTEGNDKYSDSNRLR